MGRTSKYYPSEALSFVGSGEFLWVLVSSDREVREISEVSDLRSLLKFLKLTTLLNLFCEFFWVAVRPQGEIPIRIQ